VQPDTCEVIPMTKNDIKLLKSCAQSQLPDNRQFKGDLLAAAIQVRQAQLALQDALYVLENQLEEALDRDEERRC